jgi:hypothetical protein
VPKASTIARCSMHDGNHQLRVCSGVTVTEHPVDLVTRQFEAASTHRLRFRHVSSQRSDGPPPRKKNAEAAGARP